MSAAEPRLSMTGIAKAFTGVQALGGVSFEAFAGEVHAICGENGAGKSTLMKVLGGAYTPDSGAIRIDGRPVRFAHPLQARAAGISIIHQELSLLPQRSVAANLFLGIEPTRHGLLDHRAMHRRAAELLGQVGASIRPDALVGRLSLAERQLVEIAKALTGELRILVMDEPTAALDDRESLNLLDLIRRLRDRDVAVIYISHRLPEVLAIADRITVLKDGLVVATRRRSELGIPDIVRSMVGRELGDFFPPRRTGVLRAAMLGVRGGGNAALKDVDLEVRAGEIVGVAGLEGSGKDALARALAGDLPFERGRVTLDGQPLKLDRPRAAAQAGIGYLPGDRKGEGLALGQAVRDNVRLVLRAMAHALGRPARGALARTAAGAMLRQLDVRAANFGQPIRELSGGNQQKVILGRWLGAHPRLLIFVEPTRGIDVAAKAAIYRLMRDVADQGVGILVVSSDLPEIIGISDRIIVMQAGRIAGMLEGGAGEDEVMALAVGHALAPALRAAA